VEPSIVLHDLRTHGLYPALEGERIRLYGDMRRLTDGLRQAITMNRAGIIEQLQQPAESIAYDLVDIASCAGWHPTVNGQSVDWRCGLQHSTNPMPTASLRDALTHHTADVIAVLLAVPAGCPNRSTCESQGICAAEIGESACTALAGKESPHE